MSRQFRSDDTVKWTYGFGKGAYDATIGNETASWDGSTRFQAQGVISGTAGQTSFTKPVGWAHTGLCLLHQTRGTGAGNWELAWVDFTGANAVADKPLQNTYISSGASAAQIITLSNGNTGYKNVNITGTLSAPAWNGSTGGIVAILAKETITIGGAISASGKGFRGGTTANTSGDYYHTRQQGESLTGVGSISNAANGQGGGGGGGDYSPGAGAGGGHATAGGAGGGSIAGSASSATGGNAGLTSMVSGGGGGAGGWWAGTDDRSSDGLGGNGGGIVFLACKSLTVSGSINVKGQDGDAGYAGSTGDTRVGWAGGGGGAGGSCLLKCQNAVLGSSIITGAASGGGQGYGYSGNGGAGGVGRIHLDYSGSYTGTTSPALDATLDPTIKAKAGGGMLYSNFL